ncbi:MAG: hypothetical protein ABJL67_01880 [Sulfitobacter sp.]
MVAYNFSEGFAHDLIKGLKCAALKPNGKRPHVEVGGDVHVFCGNLPPDFSKSPDCHRLITAPCTRSEPACMTPDGLVIGGRLMVNPYWPLTMAQQEGFDSYADLNTHFHRVFGLPWEGRYIRWNPARASFCAEWPLVVKPPSEVA